MTVRLTIDRLVIEVAAGQRLHPATLKRAVERELAALIGAEGPGTIEGAPVKTLVSPPAAPGTARGEAAMARGLAARIHEAMKR